MQKVFWQITCCSLFIEHMKTKRVYAFFAFFYEIKIKGFFQVSKNDENFLDKVSSYLEIHL